MNIRLVPVSCPGCGKVAEPIIKECGSGPHYAEERCPYCKKFFGYTPKPKNKEKRKKNKHTPESLSISHCQMCMRKKDSLGRYGTLAAHHIIEVASPTFGPDTPENIWVVCTSCHSLIHHQRTYLHNHFKDTGPSEEVGKC